jgi:uncharacterized glyoxalase superfamily protein PhnB
MASGLAGSSDPSPESLIAAMEEMAMLDSTVHASTAILIYDDIAAAQAYICRVFGLAPGELERDPAGVVRHGEVRAGDQVLWLHPAGDGFESPSTLGAVSGMTVVVVEDVDAHYARAVAEGADVIALPVDQDYGVREYGVRDPEGQLWFFHSPLD